MGGCWKFYADENERHYPLHTIHVDNDEACRVAFHLWRRYVARHTPLGLEFRHKRRLVNGYCIMPVDRPRGERDRYLVTVPSNPDLLIIAHELAHAWEHAMTGKTRHAEAMARLVDTLCNDLYERWA